MDCCWWFLLGVPPPPSSKVPPKPPSVKAKPVISAKDAAATRIQVQLRLFVHYSCKIQPMGLPNCYRAPSTFASFCADPFSVPSTLLLSQALARGVTLRTEWAREDAAILMQSIYRGYRARVLLSQMIEQLIKEGELG